MSTVVAMGDTMIEISLQVHDAWHASPDVAVSESTVSVGGSAANFAVYAAALGVTSFVATNVGKDSFSSLLIDDLTNYGVATELVQRESERNSMCVITIGADGDRRFHSYRAPEDSCNQDFEEAYLRLVIARIETADWLHISGFWLQRDRTAALVEVAINAAAHQGIPISLDPSPLLMETPTPLLALVLSKAEVMFPNTYEACAFTKTSSAYAAAQALSTMPPQYSVVTDGAAGSFLISDGEIHAVAAAPGPVVDTTGAGDALAAGFVAARLDGADALEALQVGARVAACAIRFVGGHAGGDSMRESLALEFSTQ